ncbi:MAG: hypothetical protein ABR600_12520 [Actinomycetota bacterium]
MSQATEAEPAEAVLYAVLDDLRNTLGVAWLDPVFRSIASDPIFVIAAWAATRPNVTKSFTESASRLRRLAYQCVEKALDPPDHRPFVFEHLGPEDSDRLIRTVRAVHHGLPKVYLVVQSWARLARRQRIPGTGREEVPARRGIAPWQDGVIVPGTAPPEAVAAIDQLTTALGVASIPSTLFALSPAPVYLDRVSRDMVERVATDDWSSALVSLRREVTAGIESFPHPMDLQWDALAARGLTEERRAALADQLREAAAIMPVNVLLAAFLCASLGGPEPSGET